MSPILFPRSLKSNGNHEKNIRCPTPYVRIPFDDDDRLILNVENRSAEEVIELLRDSWKEHRRDLFIMCLLDERHTKLETIGVEFDENGVLFDNGLREDYSSQRFEVNFSGSGEGVIEERSSGRLLIVRNGSNRLETTVFDESDCEFLWQTYSGVGDKDDDLKNLIVLIHKNSRRMIKVTDEGSVTMGELKDEVDHQSPLSYYSDIDSHFFVHQRLKDYFLLQPAANNGHLLGLRQNEIVIQSKKMMDLIDVRSTDADNMRTLFDGTQSGFQWRILNSSQRSQHNDRMTAAN